MRRWRAHVWPHNLASVSAGYLARHTQRTAIVANDLHHVEQEPTRVPDAVGMQLVTRLSERTMVPPKVHGLGRLRRLCFALLL